MQKHYKIPFKPAQYKLTQPIYHNLYPFNRKKKLKSELITSLTTEQLSITSKKTILNEKKLSNGA